MNIMQHHIESNGSEKNEGLAIISKKTFKNNSKNNFQRKLRCQDVSLILLYTLIFSTLAFSCDIKKSNIDPEDTFSKILHSGEINTSYYPLDVIQTSDGGYLILSGIHTDSLDYTWPGIEVIKTDDRGEFEWSARSESGYISPLPGLLENSQGIYFFCMDELSLQTHLIRVDMANEAIVPIRTYDNIEYPLYSTKTLDGNFLLASYSRNNRSSRLTKLTGNFDVEWSNQFAVIEDAEEKIIYHMTRLGRYFPFFTGDISNEGGAVTHYFINSFWNYSFSLIFANAGNGALRGLVNGFRYDGAVSSAVHIANNQFAFSRYIYGDNYLIPNTEIDINAVSSTNDFPGTRFPELSADAAIIAAKRITKKEDNSVLFASTTKTNQIIIHQYNTETSLLLTTKSIGFTNPVKIAAMKNTADEGLVVLAQIHISGRFPGIALYKLTEKDLK